MSYDRIQVDSGGFDQAVSHFAAHQGAGLNITVPYKIEAWRMCRAGTNIISLRADQAEAVNTLKFEADGSVIGDNTDGAGLVADLQSNLGIPLQNVHILIIGAGGAVRGVLGPLIHCQPASIIIANRTFSRASALVQRFSEGFANPSDNRSSLMLKAAGLDGIDKRPFDLIINGTAASLGGEVPQIDPHCIASDTVVYDMMYSLQPTVFMNWALTNGARAAHDGLGMLVEQAAESFNIWHGKRPDTQPVIRALRKL